ncbi:pyruvate kinase alpha/beta domain-containing protein [Chloroflexota bacterium]
MYFENAGRENTSEVLRIVKQRAKELDVKTIVVASTTGDTGVQAVETFNGFKVVIIGQSVGFREANINRFTKENQNKVQDKEGIIHFATHTFAGAGKAMKYKFDTPVAGDIMANTLYIFGQGMKVACEAAMMAADGGLVRTDETIIAIGGTGSKGGGADTAIVLMPVNSHNFFDLRIKEILCKPHF